MKSCILILLLAVTNLNLQQEQSQAHDPYPRWTKAQKYAKRGFEPIDCFAGQVKVRRKRIANQPFSVCAAKEDLDCCGKLVRTSTTDEHGHFFVEPMPEGEYFVQFEFKGAKYVVKFAIIESYQQCGDSSHIEINFQDDAKAPITSFADIDDSGEPCQASEPKCFRK